MQRVPFVQCTVASTRVRKVQGLLVLTKPYNLQNGARAKCIFEIHRGNPTIYIELRCFLLNERERHQAVFAAVPRPEACLVNGCTEWSAPSGGGRS